MKKLIKMETVAKDGHHMVTYDGKGHKDEIPDDGVVFVYKSKNGMIKATEYPDRAGSIDGKFVVTDEITAINGVPAVDGVAYNVWGIGPDYVIVSAKGDKFYIGSSNPNKSVSHPNQDKKMKAYKIIHAIYSMLV